MRTMIKSGTTVLFVSHSVAQIQSLCDRVIWLENGSIKKIGDPKEICEEYEKYMMK